MMPAGSGLIPWGKVSPGASSPAAQSSRPRQVGIRRARVADCFRYAVKTHGLKKAKAEADFFFIWGYLGSRLPRRSAHFAEDKAFSCLTATLLERTKRCQHFS